MLPDPKSGVLLDRVVRSPKAVLCTVAYKGSLAILKMWDTKFVLSSTPAEFSVDLAAIDGGRRRPRRLLHVLGNAEEAWKSKDSHIFLQQERQSFFWNPPSHGVGFKRTLGDGKTDDKTTLRDPNGMAGFVLQSQSWLLCTGGYSSS